MGYTESATTVPPRSASTSWFSLLSRRRLLLGTGALAALYPLHLEPHWLEVTRTRIRLPKLTRPMRLLHLTDLHYGFRVPLSLIDAAIDLGLAESPDVICLTGDYVTTNYTDNPWPLTGPLSRLARAAPTYAVLGNHDSAPVPEVVTGAGIRLLRNEAVHTSGGLTLMGVNWEAKAPAAIPAQGVRILLAHTPDAKDQLPELSWDLLLAGHTHGGQVVIPFLPRVVGVQDKRFIAGRYDWNNRQLFISRGVGSLFGIRFGCRPEVSLLELVPA